MPINLGSGQEVSIKELAEMIAGALGSADRFVHDAGKPNNAPHKLLDCGRLIALGWWPRISLRDGLAATCAWFTRTREAARL